jgi:hypothetical protein
MTQADEYDSPWKEAISVYFPLFLSFFFPEIHAGINWSWGYEFLDKELQKIVRNASTGNQETDKLVTSRENVVFRSSLCVPLLVSILLVARKQ